MSPDGLGALAGHNPRLRQGSIAGYNLQAVVDDRQGLIVQAIVKLIDAAVKHQFEVQYAKPKSQEVYRRRKARAELPFGHLKHNLGVRSFVLRGLSGVRAEAGILAACFNLARMITILGVSGLLQTWGVA